MSEMQNRLMTEGENGAFSTAFVSPEVFAFAVEMQNRLNRNDRKGESWKNKNATSLFISLCDQVGSLAATFDDPHANFIHRCMNGERKAADVANYAMFLAKKLKEDRNAKVRQL